jgi:hypothetical protein
VARREIDDDALQFAALDALEGIGHDVMVGAVEELRPDGADEGEETSLAFCGLSPSRRRWKAARAAAGRRR